MRPLREKLLERFRWIAPAFTIPKKVAPSYRFFVPGVPRPNSKSAAVVAELCEAGVSRNTIWTPTDDRENKVLRLLQRTPRLLYVLFRTRGSRSKLDIAERWSVLGYSLYHDMLSQCPNLTPIVISDVSPDLNMLWAAAAANGHPALWWQDDFHHTARLPFRITDAAVVNEAGAETAFRRSVNTRIARRPSIPRKHISAVPNEPRVGVVVNASFTAAPEQLKIISDLRDLLGPSPVSLRLHPNSALHKARPTEAWLSFSPKNEKLCDFAERIDIAIAGNTATQLRLVSLGVPVIHTAGLDKNGYDLYQYVAAKVCIGAPNLTLCAVDAVNTFYSDPFLSNSLNRFIGFQEPNVLQELSIFA